MKRVNFRHGRGNFQIHYALDAPPEWTDPKLREVALIHLSDGIDAVSKSSNEAERGMLPETPTICVGQPTALDPTRCPDWEEYFMDSDSRRAVNNKRRCRRYN